MARHLRGAAGIAMLAIALALPAIGETPAKADLRLPRAATPEAAGFSSEGLEALDRDIRAQVAAGFPGATLAIVHDGQLVTVRAYGYAQRNDEHGPMPTPDPMREDTVFDLASNTKMYATIYALQKLASEGRLDVDAPVSRYLPEFADVAGDADRALIRVADLLRHSAGFAADVRFQSPDAGDGRYYSHDRARTERLLPRLPRQYVAGTRNLYSDTDFMLAGMIVERISGQRLDRFVDQAFYRPLGLRRTGFALLRSGRLQRTDFAATELHGNTRDGAVTFPGIRSHTLRGEVHDEKAYYAMDQISGHAGLFSSAEELANLLSLMLDDGRRGNLRFFDADTIARFTAVAGPDPSYGLGWRLNRSPDVGWMFGHCAPAEAYGHTGWTGTFTLVDPRRRLGIVLLTNKKNTPVADPAKDGNRFVGDGFPIARYGTIVDRIYASLLQDRPAGCNTAPVADVAAATATATAEARH